MNYIIRSQAEKELYHHGVLGMKWGIRRYQPYPKGHKGGKEINEAAEKKRKIAKEIKKTPYTFDGRWGDKKDQTKNVARLDELLEPARKNLKQAKKEYEKSYKIATDFFNSKEYEKYKDQRVKEYMSETDYTSKADVLGQLYDYNDDLLAFDRYCADHNIDQQKLREKIEGAEIEYKKAMKTEVNKLLGEYGNMKYKPSKKEDVAVLYNVKNVSDKALSIIEDLDNQKRWGSRSGLAQEAARGY